MNNLKLSIVPILSCIVIIGLLSGPIFANPVHESKREQKIRAKIEKLGTGTETSVTVKLRDKMKLEGYISDINESDFDLTNRSTGKTQHILYSQVKQIKGKNNLTGEQIAWGVIIGVAILSIIMLGTD
jgi:hypothetical protein